MSVWLSSARKPLNLYAPRAASPVDDGCLRRTHAAIARSEIDAMPAEPAQAVEYSVLGKVLYEPVLTAIRRLAHQSMVVNRGGPS